MIWDVDWQAAATAFTGVLAVGAAIWIGKQQTKISRGQLDLQALSLKENLFAQRFQIYKSTQDYMVEIVRYAKCPGDAARRSFWENVDRAKFLFSPDVHSQLLEILKKSDLLDRCEQMLHGADKLPVGPDRSVWAKSRAECLEFFIERGNNLHEIFDADLRIGLPS